MVPNTPISQARLSSFSLWLSTLLCCLFHLPQHLLLAWDQQSPFSLCGTLSCHHCDKQGTQTLKRIPPPEPVQATWPPGHTSVLPSLPLPAPTLALPFCRD